MTYQRLMIAAALLLAAICGKICLPEQTERILPAVQTMIDRDSFALPLPREAVQWLDSF